MTEARGDRIPLGPVCQIPTDRCVAAAGDRVVVVRVGNEVCAYRNRCLHQEAPLAGGWVRNGILSCPLHFWRYDAATGWHRAGNGRLDRFDVIVEDEEAFVIVPPEPHPMSLRERLLARAAAYDRDAAYRDETAPADRADRT